MVALKVFISSKPSRQLKLTDGFITQKVTINTVAHGASEVRSEPRPYAQQLLPAVVNSRSVSTSGEKSTGVSSCVVEYVS